MKLEPGIVKTVSLDNEQLLVIESPRGDCVCVIHRGAYLIGCSPAQDRDRSGGSVSWPWREWIRNRFTWHRSPAGASHWKGLRPVQWA